MKNFFKFTLLKLATSVVLIAIFILGRRMTALSEFPTETILFKLDAIIFKPVSFVSNALVNLCTIITPEALQFSICNSPVYSVYGFSSFIFELLEYYILACLFLYILNKAVIKLKK